MGWNGGSIALEPESYPRRRSSHRSWPFLALLSFGALTVVVFHLSILSSRPSGTTRAISSSLQADLEQCRLDSIRPSTTPAFKDRVNPRAAQHKPFVLTNANVIDGNGVNLGRRDVLVVEGTIKTILRPGTLVGVRGHDTIDLGGRYLTPGIVDMHSHLGTWSQPRYEKGQDMEELSGPVTPHFRAIDGFDPSDEALPRVRSGGVTSTLVLTNSGNLISGEGFALKTRLPSSMSVSDMAIQAGENPVKPERYLKMANGENTKYPREGYPEEPHSRLSEAARFREVFEEAGQLKIKQEEWCVRIEERGWTSGMGRYPLQPDPGLQTLVDALRGDMRVNIHTYTTEDIEMMLRLAEDTGLKINALHHAIETYRLIDRLKPFQPLTLALFATEFGFKGENMRTSVNNAALMHAANFSIAAHTDHPAVNGQFPMREASMMYNFGLPAEAALASLFSVPAKAMGFDHRIGYVREGMDADLVVWDDHPLQLGATPLQVWVDGEAQIEAGSGHAGSSAWDSAKVDAPVPKARGQVGRTVESSCQAGVVSFVVENVNSKLHPSGEGKDTMGRVVIRDGTIVCTGTCEDAARRVQTDGGFSMNMTDGFLLPTLTALTPMHGLTEMLSDPTTSDGYVDASNINPVHAKYGLSPAGIHVERANMAGVGAIITPPRAMGPTVFFRLGGGGFIKGISMAFCSGISSASDEPVFIKEDVALHVTVGDAAKSSLVPTVSSQIQMLTDLISKPPNEDWMAVSKGDMPLAVHVDSADFIALIIRMKRSHPSLRPIIIGGAEAWLEADGLARAGIPVVLAPWRCQQHTWEYRRCHPGPPLEDTTSIQILLEHGVKVALAAGDDRNIRNMWFEASWGSKMPSLAHPDTYPDKDMLAIELLSKNNEEIFEIHPDHATSFSIWEGNPFEFGAKPAVIFGRGEVERCWPSYE